MFRLRRRMLAVTIALGIVAGGVVAPSAAQASPWAAYLSYASNGPGTPWHQGVYCVNYALAFIFNQRETVPGETVNPRAGTFNRATDQGVRNIQHFFHGAAASDGVVGPRTGNLIKYFWIIQNGTASWDNTCEAHVPT